MVIIDNIYKSFGAYEVLKGINLEVKKSEVVAIVGPSGAGKTTLLQLIGTLLFPDKGKVRIAGIDPFQLSEKELSLFRNTRIGFVFQFHHLLPEFTACENIFLPALIKGTDKKQAEKQSLELLQLLGISDKANNKPSELSGGEQQRVAIARALINEPSIILADEPSGNLDSKNKKDLHKLFFKLREKFNQTFIIVTHDNELATMSDRIVHIADGKIVD